MVNTDRNAPCTRTLDNDSSFIAGGVSCNSGIYTVLIDKLHSKLPPLILNVGGHKVAVGPNILRRIGILRDMITIENGKTKPVTGRADVPTTPATSKYTLPLSYDRDSACLYIESCPHDFRTLLHFLRRGEASMEFIERHMAYSEFLTLFKVYDIDTMPKRCLRCMAVYDEDVNKYDPCLRHPGQPVVTKKCTPYWSCCNAPCLTVDSLGRQRTGYGCMSGKHEPDTYNLTPEMVESLVNELPQTKSEDIPFNSNLDTTDLLTDLPADSPAAMPADLSAAIPAVIITTVQQAPSGCDKCPMSGSCPSRKLVDGPNEEMSSDGSIIRSAQMSSGVLDVAKTVSQPRRMPAELEQESPCGDCLLKDYCDVDRSANKKQHKMTSCALNFMARNLPSEVTSKLPNDEVDCSNREEIDFVMDEWSKNETLLKQIQAKHERGEVLSKREEEMISSVNHLKKNTFKTKFCPLNKFGVCPNVASACRFAHSLSERRFTDDLYKTQLCAFWKNGKCRAGIKCRHAHGLHDLRAKPNGNKRTSADQVPNQQDEPLEQSTFPLTSFEMEAPIDEPTPLQVQFNSGSGYWEPGQPMYSESGYQYGEMRDQNEVGPPAHQHSLNQWVPRRNRKMTGNRSDAEFYCSDPERWP